MLSSASAMNTLPAPSDTMAAADRLGSLPTPFLVVNAAAVHRNIKGLADYASKHHIGIRPHTKTHKSRLLARLQLEAGAIGLTVAKVGEAEQMMHQGEDLLMAYPAVDLPRCARLAQFALTRIIRVAVDSPVCCSG
jgi:D-serine deaminase-like pyridoxal phosphate-dependent protein